MDKVDSAFLIAVVCGIWSEAAYYNHQTFTSVITILFSIAWLFTSANRRAASKEKKDE